jgi:hypothetical protein
MSEILCQKFNAVSTMILKRNQWQRWLESFGRIRDKVWSRALSGLRVMGYGSLDM